MNIIGIFAPKIVSLIFILVSPVLSKSKAILVTIWLIKAIIDYDVSKPGHAGVIYKLVKNMTYESGELVINCIQFVPTVVFLWVTLQMNTWILLIPGVTAVFVRIIPIFCCIKDIIDEQKMRNRK